MSQDNASQLTNSSKSMGRKISSLTRRIDLLKGDRNLTYGHRARSPYTYAIQ
ncbi:hypothetical protein NPIL_491131, partial [Nephila pilipes]